MKVLLVDDEVRAIQNLSKFLEKYCPEVNVIGEAGSVHEAVLQIRKLQPQAIFLDIKMKDGTGFDVLEHFPNRTFEVVFVTAFDKHAVKAFEFSARDYLLKPLDRNEVMRSVNRLKTFLKVYSENQTRPDLDKLIEVKTKGGHKLIRLHELEYLEADSNYSTLYLQDGSSFLSTKGLKDYENTLPANFLRIHQSYIVNIYRIDFYRKSEFEVVMKSGAVTKISRRKREIFLSLMG